jgi:hypothetical protein
MLRRKDLTQRRKGAKTQSKKLREKRAWHAMPLQSSIPRGGWQNGEFLNWREQKIEAIRIGIHILVMGGEFAK